MREPLLDGDVLDKQSAKGDGSDEDGNENRWEAEEKENAEGVDEESLDDSSEPFSMNLGGLGRSHSPESVLLHVIDSLGAAILIPFPSQRLGEEEKEQDEHDKTVNSEEPHRSLPVKRLG